MKLLFQILIFVVILSLSKYDAYPQTLSNTDLYLVRGDSKEFEFTYLGDVTADELLFVVKADTAIASPRLIQKMNDIAGGDQDQIIATYKKPFTKIKIKFYPIDTEDLLRNRYVFDLTRTNPADSTDHTHLFIGRLNLQPTIATPGDGSNVPLDGTRFYFAGIDSSNKEPGIAIFRNSDNSMEYLSFEEALDSMNGVTTNTLQNITKQKNFLDGIKVGSDTTFTIKITSGSYPTGIDIRPSTLTYYEFLKFTPPDDNSVDFTITFGEVDWIPENPGSDLVYTQGYNWYGNKLRPQFGRQSEYDYEFNDTTKVYESFDYFNNLPSPHTTFAVRPYGLSVYEYPSGYSTEIALRGDVFNFLSSDDDNKIKITNSAIQVFLPLDFEESLDSTDQITIRGGKSFLRLAKGEPAYRLGFGSYTDNHLGLYYSNSTPTASQINDSYALVRFHPDSIVFNKYVHFGVNNSIGLSVVAGSSNASLKSAGILSLDAAAIWFRNYVGNTNWMTINDNGTNITLGNTAGTGTANLFAGAYYTGSAIGYLTSAWSATSDDTNPTKKRTLTINGVTVTVATYD